MGEPKLNRKVCPLGVKRRSIAELLQQMSHTAFQGRRLGEALHTWQAMLADPEVTIVLGLAGSMATAGQWRLVNWLIEKRFVDVIVATGANVSEDIVPAMGGAYYQGEPDADDAALLEADLNRYYDTYGRETDYRDMELLIAEWLVGLDPDRAWSGMQLLHGLGQWLAQRNIDAIVAQAARHGVPVFCPAMVDSAYGEAFLLARHRGRDLRLDPIAEFDQFVSIGERARELGVIYIGGGVPKDFSQLLAISVSPRRGDEPIAGRAGFRRRQLREYYYPHKYAIQITADSPQWGGLSGCTLEEAVSWGKILAGGRHVTCYCDATIALPLLAHALAETVERRAAVPDLSWLFDDGG